MGKKPPPPDPRIGEAAVMQAEIAAQAQQDANRFAQMQLDFAQQQHGDYLGLQQQQLGLAETAMADARAASQAQIDLGKSYLSHMQQQAAITNGWAEEDRARYKSTFVPLQDAWIAEANAFDSPERKAMAADEAVADVRQQFALGRQQNERQMAAVGVAPNSGRYQSSANRLQTTESLAAAGGANAARRRTEDTGRAMRASAINMGAGLAVNPGTSMSLSNAATNAGFGGAMQGLGSGTATMMGGTQMGMNGYGNAANIMNAGNSLVGNSISNAGNMVSGGAATAMQGQSNMAGILNNQYQNQMNAWSQGQASLGSALGGLGTIAGYAMFSSKDYKTAKRKPMSVLKAVRDMPVEEWEYKQGIGDGGGKKHVGPYAEDFQKATGLGNGKEISIIDAIGVTMGAVQELADKVDKIAPKRAAA